MNDRPGFEMLAVAEWAYRKKRAWIRTTIRRVAPEATRDDVDDLEQEVYKRICRAKLQRGPRWVWIRRLVEASVIEWRDQHRSCGIPHDPADCDWDGYTPPAQVRRTRELLGEVDPDDDGPPPYRELEDF